VLAELKIFLRAGDPYRAEPGRDAEGQNVYRVTLRRLDELEGLLGPGMADVIGFARAECHERLGQWDSAARAFEAVSVAGTSLSSEAGARGLWARRLGEATEPRSEGGSLQTYLNGLDVRLRRLQQIAAEAPPAPYDAYVQVEIERALQTKAKSLFDLRMVLPDGLNQALQAAQKLAEEHAESRRAGEHWLLLGAMYEGIATDYLALRDPTGSDFETERWAQWVDQARAAYARAAERDGDPAKPEGQARLRALDALALRTLERAR